MCGIVGVIGASHVGHGINAAITSISHRGPDDRGIHRDGEVILGHARLSIIDLSHSGHQPMVDEATKVAIVFNGEIYNYRALRNELTSQDFRSNSDTEVLLRLYLREGIGFISRLRGMFAFAIWDPRTKTVHLARDGFGIKPLHYSLVDETLIFGSEIKAILALGVPARPDRRVFRDYLMTGGFADRPQTFFDGILSLETGTVLSCQNGKMQFWRYWSPMDEAPMLQLSADPERDVWDAFVDSVRHHVIADVPVAISLSSGLDSLAITHALARIGVKEMHAFTFGFEDKNYDEVSRIERGNLPLDLLHHTVTLECDEMLSLLTEAVNFYEVPLGGVGTIGFFKMARRVGDEGIKVLLSGEGSDELFAGYKYYYYAHFRDLHESGDEDRLFGAVTDFEQFYGETLDPRGETFHRLVLGGSGQRVAPDGTQMSGRIQLAPDLADLAWDDAGALAERLKTSRFTALRRTMMRDLAIDKVPKQLWYDDRGAMASSVEVRVPFLDRPLFDVARSLPPEWLIRRGSSKAAIRGMLNKFCGLDFGDARKHFVSTPQREWLKGPLLASILRVVKRSALADAGLIDLPAFIKSCETYAAQSELGNSFFIWQVLNAALLFDRFFARAAR